MGTTVDSLDIQIAAQAGKANQSLDALVRRLDRITSSLTRAGGSGMNQMAVGVSRLASAMQKMNAIGTADFTRLANNMAKLSAVDAGKLRSSAVAIGGLTKSLSNLSNVRVSDNAKQISDLAHGIAQLGYKSATQAIQNIPQLAISMQDLMTTLSGAPRVSQNLIDMTNALARLARTGSSSGRAATSLSSALNTYSRSTTRAKKHTFSLASAIGKVYATYWLLFRAFGKLKDAIDISSQLTEVQNVVSTTFGEYSGLVDQMASTSITELGMSELTVKQIASRYQAMGSAMGFARGEMADMSLELTRLAADMASFYNVEQKDVAEDLAAIFTGETRPLRSYGIDLTQATLAEWAMKQGLDANIQSMSQAEKAMLRYQYVMANTTAAQGDFAKTSNTWANQTRILAQNFQSLGSIIGGVLINAFKPLVSGLNSVMSAVISTAETIANALGAIFGWTIEIFPSGSVADDYTSGLDGVADSANNASGGLGNAADKAKELKRALMGFDEIEKLPDDTGSSGSGGSGGGSGGGGAGSGNGSGGATAAIVPTESLFEKYKSDIKTLEQLGEYISDSLTKAMNNIEWSKIYGNAINFGTDLASFLNGLISPELFGSTATTIANSLNTALFALNSFGDTFEWDEFGLSLAESVKVFFKDFKWNLAADTFNTLADGILTSILTAAEETDWAYLGGRIVVFISGIDWKNLFWKIGQIIWEVINGAIETAATVFEADGIENKIAGVILGLKFLGIGATFGLKVWGVITKSILGKGVTDLASQIIGRHVSNNLGTSIASRIGENTFINTVGGALKSALGKAGVYVAIIEAANAIQSFSEKVRGGNGQLSEMGGILDSIASNFAPDLSDKIFRLKENLEDSGASTEEFAEAFTELFQDAGVSAEQLITAYNNVAGSINTTVEQEEMMKAVIENISKASEEMADKAEGAGSKTSYAYSSIKDALILMQKDGVIPSNEHMSSLLSVLEEQSASGSTTSESLKAVSETLELMGISAEDAAKYLNEIPDKVSIDADTKPAIKRFNILGNQLEKSSFKTPIEALANKKNIITPLEKLLKKNPLGVETEIETSETEIQSKLNRYDLGIDAEVKTKTSAPVLQSSINQTYKNLLLTLPTKIGTSANTLQSQIINGFRGFLLNIDANANANSITDNLSTSQKTFGVTAKYQTVIDSLTETQKTLGTTSKYVNSTDALTAAQKTLNTLSKYTSSSDSLTKGEKTVDTTAKYTSSSDSLTKGEKTIGGIKGKIESLTKKSGLSLALTAAISVIKSGLQLLFKKDGGVLRNGSWSPITAFAGGGIPDMGQMFVAREAGPELVGTLGGHTAVMNNDQIVASVSAGVYQAVRAAMSGGNQNITVNVALEGDARGLFRVVKQENDRLVLATGKPALLT